MDEGDGSDVLAQSDESGMSLLIKYYLTLI
jgi:hypothetical protein